MIPLLKPNALKVGDTIAVISPAAPSSRESLEAGCTYLDTLGFKSVLMPYAGEKEAYLAGSDAQRLEDLQEAFTREDVQGIFCARGGYGSMRLLSHLNFQCVQSNPKVFIGFSDITVLHLAFLQQTGLVGFYGPMLTSNLIHSGEEVSSQALLPMVMGQAQYPLEVENRDPYVCFRGGTVEAPLVGGNLSLLAALCGTPWQPDTSGTILFIEDWREQYYTLDRQFQQLRLAGLFDGIVGLLLCDFSQIERDTAFDLQEHLRRLVADLNVPTGYGFSVGHGTYTATLPIGDKVKFCADTGQLYVLESPVLVV